jgi:hypothetical protein
MRGIWELRLGQERPVKLAVLQPPGEWEAVVSGMRSAVRVQKLWASDPYSGDDEDNDEPRTQPSMVFMISAVAPGEATVSFAPSGSAADAEPREIRISVTR